MADESPRQRQLLAGEPAAQSPTKTDACEHPLRLTSYGAGSIHASVPVPRTQVVRRHIYWRCSDCEEWFKQLIRSDDDRCKWV